MVLKQTVRSLSRSPVLSLSAIFCLASVGVVSDIKNVGPDRPPQPEIYRPYAQAGGGMIFPLMVSTDIDPALIARPVTRAVLGVDPQAAVGRVQPMEDVIAASMARPRFYLVLIAAFAAVATVLAMAGLYGVMSFAVEQRRREIGIRSALGSRPLDNLTLVMRSGGSLIGLGVALGLGGGFLATRLLEGMLFGLSTLDPAAWTVASALLAAAGLAAVAAAGRRAAAVEPMVALRD